MGKSKSKSYELVSIIPFVHFAISGEDFEDLHSPDCSIDSDALILRCCAYKVVVRDADGEYDLFSCYGDDDLIMSINENEFGMRPPSDGTVIDMDMFSRFVRGERQFHESSNDDGIGGAVSFVIDTLRKIPDSPIIDKDVRALMGYGKEAVK